MASEQNNQRIKKFLEQSYGKELTDVEVAEYKDRFVKFASLLVEIDKKSKKKKS